MNRSASLMIVGTASHVGKSVLCAGLCRLLKQDGHAVAPFKAQNMSLNSAVTPSGREIGRAQAVQAEAAGILPNEHMNPILLKPTGAARTQVVLQGRVHATVSAREYFTARRDDLWAAVCESYAHLRERHEVVVIEGAGSPVELNLKARDIVNMRVAEMADAVVILVADIDRGGVFAAVVGTLALLTPAERARVRGVIVNNFRGDSALFADGVALLEACAGIPVLGVIPHIPDLRLDEEDSLGLTGRRYRGRGDAGDAADRLRIAVIRLPYMANFTDIDPLFLEPDVDAAFVADAGGLIGVDAVILPGTKNTVDDMLWLDESGLAAAVRGAARAGVAVFGICGGFQMLGRRVDDPHGVETDRGGTDGICLLPHSTTLLQEKTTLLVSATLRGVYAGISVRGYEIHMGLTDLDGAAPFGAVDGTRVDGAMSDDGRIAGTYLHGVMHNAGFRRAWLNRLRERRGWPPLALTAAVDAPGEQEYDRFAGIVRRHLDLARIYGWLGLPVAGSEEAAAPSARASGSADALHTLPRGSWT